MATTEMTEAQRKALIEELLAQQACVDEPKDILVVAHDQPEFVRNCVESVFATTRNFHLYLWDNGSAAETKEYLEQVAAGRPNVTLRRSENNQGFIVPNNELCRLGSNPWVILLNSDTLCQPGWDTAMIGWLQQRPEYGVCGYQGGLLTEDCLGAFKHHGADIDYVVAWCLCTRRETVERVGLFDAEALDFAYAEDSDFGLRARAAGEAPYALHVEFVLHKGGATYRAVSGQDRSRLAFIRNHGVVKDRWKDYLARDRAILRLAKVREQPV